MDGVIRITSGFNSCFSQSIIRDNCPVFFASACNNYHVKFILDYIVYLQTLLSVYIYIYIKNHY